MAQLKSFRELIVWQKSFAFALTVYGLTETFPTHERFGLTSQLRRASLSIASNIAEGYCRNTRKDYAHFLDNALGSSAELETQILFSEKLKYLTLENSEKLIKDIIEIQKILYAIKKKLRAPPLP